MVAMAPEPATTKPERSGDAVFDSGAAFDQWFEANKFPAKTRRVRSLAFEYGWRAAKRAMLANGARPGEGES
jgi:hypothetical protein